MAIENRYGVVIVHKAPLFLKPDLQSPVVDYVDKNDSIVIHRKHFIDYEKTHEMIQDSDQYSQEGLQVYGRNYKGPSFYMTIDRNGRTAYIPHQYVKLLLHDYREARTPLPSAEDDTTDYRLIEPLKKNFPFIIEGEKARTQLLFGMGWPNNTPYPYATSIDGERSSLSFEVMGNYSLSAKDIFKSPLFQLGGQLSFTYRQNNYALQSKINSSERNYKIIIGPLLTFDHYRRSTHQLSSFILPELYLFDQTSITQHSSEKEENLTFNRLHLGIKVGFTYQQYNLFNGDHDAVIGFFARWIPPHHPSANSSTTLRPNYWPSGNIYRKGHEWMVGLHFGGQYRPGE